MFITNQTMNQHKNNYLSLFNRFVDNHVNIHLYRNVSFYMQEIFDVNEHKQPLNEGQSTV